MFFWDTDNWYIYRIISNSWPIKAILLNVNLGSYKIYNIYTYIHTVYAYMFIIYAVICPHLCINSIIQVFWIWNHNILISERWADGAWFTVWRTGHHEHDTLCRAHPVVPRCKQESKWYFRKWSQSCSSGFLNVSRTRLRCGRSSVWCFVIFTTSAQWKWNLFPVLGRLRLYSSGGLLHWRLCTKGHFATRKEFSF